MTTPGEKHRKIKFPKENIRPGKCVGSKKENILKKKKG